jgi:putative membrane protein
MAMGSIERWVPDTAPQASDFDPRVITRPHPRLFQYYVIVALLTGPAFPITIIPLFFKYQTLRYAFDDSGISMRWGILFHKEINLTYRRIQDIHLTRNLIQRWMGLATVAIQTASGSSSPEMSIEGVLEADALRDFLYAKMRGARGEVPGAAEPGSLAPSEAAAEDEALALLREIRDALGQLADKDSAS